MSTGQEYDKDAALANLTPEERAAIEDDGDDDKNDEAVKALAGDAADADDEDGDDDDDGDDDEDGEGDADPAPTKKADDTKANSGEPGDDDGAASADDDEEDAAVVQYRVELPEDFKDQVSALDQRESELAAKFKAGDIEADAFIAENKAIAAERSKLDRLQTKAEMAEEMTEQAAKHRWQRTVSKFMDRVAKDDGVDYRNDKAMNKTLDNLVKALAADPDNNDKPERWFLEQAHKAVKAMHAVEGKKAPADKGADDGKPKKPAPRKPPVDKLPATLANVPGGDGPGDVGDEFADIDNLEGLEYETALAKMTPAQRERYMAAA